SAYQTMEVGRERRHRSSNWEMEETLQLIELWEVHIDKLVCARRTKHVYAAMAQQLAESTGRKPSRTPEEARRKIFNLTKQWRLEYELISTSGGNSTWPLFLPVSRVLNKRPVKQEYPDTTIKTEPIDLEEERKHVQKRRFRRQIECFDVIDLEEIKPSEQNKRNQTRPLECNSHKKAKTIGIGKDVKNSDCQSVCTVINTGQQFKFRFSHNKGPNSRKSDRLRRSIPRPIMHNAITITPEENDEKDIEPDSSIPEDEVSLEKVFSHRSTSPVMFPNSSFTSDHDTVSQDTTCKSYLKSEENSSCLCKYNAKLCQEVCLIKKRTAEIELEAAEKNKDAAEERRKAAVESKASATTQKLLTQQLLQNARSQYDLTKELNNVMCSLKKTLQVFSETLNTINEETCD
ncbi:unnamed protein product, partial [Meganyctiphanes norvegica]